MREIKSLEENVKEWMDNNIPKFTNNTIGRHFKPYPIVFLKITDDFNNIWEIDFTEGGTYHNKLCIITHYGYNLPATVELFYTVLFEEASAKAAHREGVNND